MTHTIHKRTLFVCLLFVIMQSSVQAAETLPALQNEHAPQNFAEMWAGFDPRSEPLETEVLKEWEEDGVVLQIVRFRIGVFKGKTARLAAVFGYPKQAVANKQKLPGLLQIHGGGQYADYRACLLNAKRGYATLSIAWAGRINAPDYQVTPAEVKLFWDGTTDDPRYNITTDWGALDGYHAPGKNPGNQFPGIEPEAWTLDNIESPRNSGWFLCALAARRALTFLERQPLVDPDRLGVYGHSMGGKLTVLTAPDARVKAAAPSCGGISDRYNRSPLFCQTLGDNVSLKQITCPIIFLSPANDFHGRIGNLPTAIAEIQSSDWRVTCSPHHNHQDTPDFEVATMLWMDQHLKGSFVFPQTPKTELTLNTTDGVPRFTVIPDESRTIHSIDVYYSRQGKTDEGPQDRLNTKHRFWHHVKPAESVGCWIAKLPLGNVNQPLWVYTNIRYALDEPVSGAGYYYRPYTTKSFNLSSLLQMVSPTELQAAGVQATREPSLLIEDFQDNWRQEWFSYQPDKWAITTHKLNDGLWKAPPQAQLALEVRAAEANQMVVVLDDYATEVELTGGPDWQTITLKPSDFQNLAGESLSDWQGIRQLKLTPAEAQRPTRGSKTKQRILGKNWRGPQPTFQNLHWQVDP